jgi:curved DNA-binding protein CbpA
MNHYVVLGVPMDADDQVIRTAFRSLVRRYHPDAGEGSSPEKFRLLVEAYETLSDPTRRRAYDRSLRPVRPPMRIPVEPMRGPVEPLQGRRRPPVTIRSTVSFAWASRFDELFDELWNALEDDFFPRRFPSRW